MKHLTTTVSHIPACPGLYVIGHEEQTLGFACRRKIAYVGQSNNIRRRLGEHYPLTELNTKLRAYLRSNSERGKVWYTTDLEVKDLDEYERKLIRALKPTYNDKHNKKVGSSE